MPSRCSLHNFSALLLFILLLVIIIVVVIRHFELSRSHPRLVRLPLRRQFFEEDKEVLLLLICELLLAASLGDFSLERDDLLGKFRDFVPECASLSLTKRQTD